MTDDPGWPQRDKVRVSRRQVAAIAFLANIRVEDEAEEDLPGLHCLQGTEVLENYRKSFRARRKVPLRKTGGQPKKEDARTSTSRDREKTPEMSGEAGMRPGGSLRKRSTMENKENRGVAVNKARRQLSHGDDTGKVCSSMESVIGFGDSRVRQMSGTLSENSHSSVREVVYIKSDDQAKVAEERMVFISHSKVPFSVSSTIPYNKYSKTSRRYSVSRLSLRGGDRYGHDLSRRHRHQSGLALPAISDSFDAFELLGLDRTEAGQEISYSDLLEPSYERKEPQQPLDSEADLIQGPVSDSTVGALSCQGEQELGAGAWGAAVGAPYSPHLLDGWLGAGKHRTFLTFPSYITSIIEYVKPSDMKKELNEKFSERFPHAQITLSKLRSIKVEMRRIGLECSIDTVTIAQAYVYFEKLVLKNIINKVNRKFCAGASIILAAKLNDCKGDQLKMVIEKTETIFRLNRRDLLASEFAILVALEFSLHIPSQEIFPHYQRLLYQT